MISVLTPVTGTFGTLLSVESVMRVCITILVYNEE